MVKILIGKATYEIHERLDVRLPGHGTAPAAASFWPVVAQIVVLDVVFSLDSVITAVGMVDELYVMMAAVVIAVAVMLIAAKPLSDFISARPSLIILCLGFLLMIGLVLVRIVTVVLIGIDDHILRNTVNKCRLIAGASVGREGSAISASRAATV